MPTEIQPRYKTPLFDSLRQSLGKALTPLFSFFDRLTLNG